MENEIYQVHKTKRICQNYLSKLIRHFFTISAHTMRQSAKIQQSEVETIQRTVTNRNITQDTGNINRF